MLKSIIGLVLSIAVLAILITGCSDEPEPIPSNGTDSSATTSSEQGVNPEPTHAPTSAVTNTAAPEAATPTPAALPTATATPAATAPAATATAAAPEAATPTPAALPDRHGNARSHGDCRRTGSGNAHTCRSPDRHGNARSHGDCRRTGSGNAHTCRSPDRHGNARSHSDCRPTKDQVRWGVRLGQRRGSTTPVG